MNANAKQQPEQECAVGTSTFRVPASIEEAYELGWQWQRESFVGLRECGTTKEGVTKREGLAYFVNEQETGGIVIPFVATYEFGTPRHPKYPYTGGSVLSVDKEPEAPEVETPEEEEEERVSLWKAEAFYKGQVIETLEARGTRRAALNEICDAVSLELDATEITDQPSVEESTPPESQHPSSGPGNSTVEKSA